MPRIFRGSESELRLLLSKSLKDLSDVSIILYTTDLQEAIEVIDGIAIEDNIATLILAPRAFIGMEDGVLNYIVKAKSDGQEYHMERQSNYVLKSISHINEDGVATQTIEITKNGEYMITPNDGLYVNLNVAIEDENGSFDDGYTEGYSIGQAEGYGTGYVVGYETGQNEGVAEYVETLPVQDITENGEYREITKGVNVNVPNQTTKLEVTENGTYTPPIPFIGYDEVDVQVDIPEIQSDKTITLYAGETGTITPDQGYDAMDKVNYTCVAGASKTVLPNGLILSGSTFTVFDGNNYDVSEKTDLSYFFQDCNQVKTMDLSSWDMSKVRALYSIFQGCRELTDLDLTGWDVGNVLTMTNTFYNCVKLSALDVSNWNTGKVTGMSNMFQSCSALTELDVLNWDTSKVTSMNSMFSSCKLITSLNLTNWDTSKVTTMDSMFANCNALTELNVSNCDTGKVTDMSGMFLSCQGLTELNVSNWDTGKVTDMSSMFNYCINLTELYGIENFDTSNVTNMANMFNYCKGFTSLNLTNWDTSKVTNMSNMFANCLGLTELRMGGDVSKVTNVSNMFNNIKTTGTFYYNPQYDYSKIIAVLPATWTAVPMN